MTDGPIAAATNSRARGMHTTASPEDLPPDRVYSAAEFVALLEEVL
ncbi:MAG: hypothetical protein ACLPVY_17380 [Acidimicrobiia bacterium]